jgi:hypothetical protein
MASHMASEHFAFIGASTDNFAILANAAHIATLKACSTEVHPDCLASSTSEGAFTHAVELRLRDALSIEVIHRGGKFTRQIVNLLLSHFPSPLFSRILVS